MPFASAEQRPSRGSQQSPGARSGPHSDGSHRTLPCPSARLVLSSESPAPSTLDRKRGVGVGGHCRLGPEKPHHPFPWVEEPRRRLRAEVGSGLPGLNGEVRARTENSAAGAPEVGVDKASVSRWYPLLRLPSHLHPP